jgi:Na+-driven multidrug efflux pump
VFGTRLIVATGAVASVQGPAATYLRVRTFAQPALLVSIVTQSCLLAQRDSRSPALAVLLQVVINAVLDTVLIVAFKAGVTGAAWATVIAQYLGMLLLLQRLRAKRRVLFGSVQQGLQRARVLWATLAPLTVVYVSRNLCYALLQVPPCLPLPEPLLIARMFMSLRSCLWEHMRVRALLATQCWTASTFVSVSAH